MKINLRFNVWNHKRINTIYIKKIYLKIKLLKKIYRKIYKSAYKYSKI